MRMKSSFRKHKKYELFEVIQSFSVQGFMHLENIILIQICLQYVEDEDKLKLVKNCLFYMKKEAHN